MGYLSSPFFNTLYFDDLIKKPQYMDFITKGRGTEAMPEATLPVELVYISTQVFFQLATCCLPATVVACAGE